MYIPIIVMLIILVMIITIHIDNNEVNRTLLMDIFWALGSICFVTAYLWWHTGSLLLAIGSFFIIFISIPVAYCYLLYYSIVFCVYITNIKQQTKAARGYIYIYIYIYLSMYIYITCYTIYHI